jgi:hypothetical protein
VFALGLANLHFTLFNDPDLHLVHMRGADGEIDNYTFLHDEAA